MIVKILTCFIAVTAADKLAVQNLLAQGAPPEYRIFSNEIFHASLPITLLSEVDQRRPKEAKCRLFQYINFSAYDYIIPAPISCLRNQEYVPLALNNKIGLVLTETPIAKYNAFLTLSEAKEYKNNFLYRASPVFIPTSNSGLLFMDFWNRYTTRLKAEHQDLAITLVALRHFRNHYIELPPLVTA